MGHQNQWRIEEARVREALAGATAPPAPPPATAETKPPEVAAEPLPPQAPPASLSADQVEIIVNQALDRKLAPLLSAMAEMQDPGPTVGDVLGGIGYILRLVGLGAYLNARRRKSSADRDES